MSRYFAIMLAVLALLLGAVWFGDVQCWWTLPSLWIQVLLFLFIVTLIIGFNLIRIRKNQPQVFVQFYLLSISVKMVAGLIFIFFLVWDNPVQAAPVATLFMVGYILFTSVEVVFLLGRNPDQ
jgi:hypothetical protein